MSAAIELPGEPSSVSRARRYCTDRLAEWGAPDPTAEVVALLTSELVTNVVLHARSPVRLEIARDGDEPSRDHRVVRVTVFDRDPTLPVAKRHDPQAGSGRGLQLVEALAERHGSAVDGDGKAVWFEVPWDAA